MAAPLDYDTTYYFYIGTGVTDVLGNHFAGNTWSQSERDQHKFTTIPGMTVQVSAEKTDAVKDDSYMNGWRYRYEMTLNTTETKLQVQFPNGWQKSGGGDSIATDGNMKMLIDESNGGQISGVGWNELLIKNGDSDDDGDIHAYDLSTTWAEQVPLKANISGLDSNPNLAGRQIVFYVFTKIPEATLDGIYSASYGIQTGN
jgi:hypothetical protein